MIMVEQDGSTLEHASEVLKNDKEFVLCAVKNTAELYDGIN